MPIFRRNAKLVETSRYVCNADIWFPMEHVQDICLISQTARVDNRRSVQLAEVYRDLQSDIFSSSTLRSILFDND